MSGTADTALPQALGEETTQLFQAFGQMRYAEAEPLMRRYIPKNSGFYGSARAAAVYALGKLHEDELVDDLARQFASRLSDIDPMNPELNEVRRFAAIGLGRMKAAGQTRVLERFHQEENSSVDIGAATRWALIRITGETMPPLKSLEYREMGWFLEPN
jgi:HEAT repeat protein